MPLACSLATCFCVLDTLDAQFRFDQSMLKRLNSADFQVVEQILERLAVLGGAERQELLPLVTGRLATKLGTDAPRAEAQVRFLEDLLATEYRRRDRSLA
jgi:hypothetical protein